MPYDEDLMDFDAEKLYPYPLYRKVAYPVVILASGKVLNREVVVFDGEGRAVAHFPLRKEIPFVEWRKTTFYMVE